MTPHIPEEFSTRLIDWSSFVIMGNTIPPFPWAWLSSIEPKVLGDKEEVEESRWSSAARR
jgi:hypothetical protein